MARTVILGIDGLPCWMWRGFVESGVMPRTRQLVDSSLLVPMQSSLPEVSSAAWASIVTGRNPGGHNVYGFTDLVDGGYMLGFTSSRTFKAEPFWREPGLRHLIINVPQSYPAAPMSGALVSGFVALDLKRAVYPQVHLPALEARGYRVDADMSTIEISKEKFLADLHAVLKARVAALDYLWSLDEWDRVMFVLTGVDRLNHYMWEDFEDAASPYHQAFLDYYHEVDKALDLVLQRTPDDATVIAVSDHGFGPQRVSVNVNCLLHQYGFLSATAEERISYNHLSPQTRAFAMDPGRIYIHRRGRYPKALLPDEEAEAVMDELTHLFLSLEIDGRPLVERVLRGAEIYSGPYVHRAPDLVLIGADDVALSGRLQLRELLEPTAINGKHTVDQATFLYRGVTAVDLPSPMRVEDVLGVMRAAERRRAAA